MIEIFDTTTELEAVNYLLRASGELEVDSLNTDDLSPEAESILKYLQRSRRGILTQGWEFNTDTRQELTSTNVTVAEPVYAVYTDNPTYLQNISAQGIDLYQPDVEDAPTAYRSFAFALDHTANERPFFVTGTEVGQTKTESYHTIEYSIENTRWEFSWYHYSGGAFVSKYIFAHTGETDSPYPPKNGWSLTQDGMVIGEVTSFEIIYTADEVTDAGNYAQYISVPAVTETHVEIPSDILKTTIRTKPRGRYTVRDGKVYNRRDATFDLTETIYADLSYLLDYTDCPDPFREWIVYRAGVEYVQQVVGDTEIANQLTGLANRARAEARAYDLRTGRYSLKK